MAYPRRSRTYLVRENRSTNCKIHEAVRMTTVTPIMFEEITVLDESMIPERFTDGGIRCNNPTKEVMDEARSIFGEDRQLGTLTSLGAGYNGTIGFSASDTFQNTEPTQLLEVLNNLATDCEKVACEVEEKRSSMPGRYFRFNVTHGVENVSLEE